ncbi:MAG: tRNA 2-selenouridine(34) synthase MnmH [Pirellulaceae bacterium]
MNPSMDIRSFLEQSRRLPIVDVRSPGEYDKGHIPGAINIPLFDDRERAAVGTTYGEAGREQAVAQGLQFVAPRMTDLAAEMLHVADPHDPHLLLHCWRGGMRSQSMAWLANQARCRVTLLDGGYKAFRQHVLQSFAQPLNLVVLSGLTGAGKTGQLLQLRAAGEQVIDLEQLARHRGSAFGGIGLGGQPTVEQFENELFDELQRLDPKRRVWLEDESRKIGTVILPNDFYVQLKQAPAIFLEVDVDTRARIIADEYSHLPQLQLLYSINRITKRLGGQNASAARHALQAGDIRGCIRILLDYYDRTYMVAKTKISRDVFIHISVEDPSSPHSTRQILQTASGESFGMTSTSHIPQPVSSD